jgi:hypothetical protein
MPMDHDRDAQRSQAEVARSRTLPRRSNDRPSLGEWAAGWVQNHRMLSRVAAWCLGFLAVAWVSTAVLEASREQWGLALYFAVTAVAAAIVCWWLSRQPSCES